MIVLEFKVLRSVSTFLKIFLYKCAFHKVDQEHREKLKIINMTLS